MYSLILSLLLISCSYNESSNNDQNNTNTPTPSPSPSIYEGVELPNGNNDPFYTFNIVAMGPNNNWDSRRDPQAIQEFFISDRLLSFRIVPQEHPARGSKTSMQPISECRMDDSYQYTKLSVTIEVKSTIPQNSSSYTYTFNEISVNKISEVFRLPLPPLNNSTYPFQVKVLAVKNDFVCTFRKNPKYCPVSATWNPDCVRFLLQMATDNSKQFPN